MSSSRQADAKLGVYLHIPYCRQICRYCDFNVRKLPVAAPWDELGAAMDQELMARAPLFDGPATSIYFGGGTPSLAPTAFIAQRLETVARCLGIAAGAEITLEADPGTVDRQQLEELKRIGIGRLSLGWQSTHAPMLKFLGRQHTAFEAEALCHLARDAGFGNLNIDVIFAVPRQTMAELKADLARLVAHQPEHVSLYALTLAPKTPIARLVARGRLPPVDESLEISMTSEVVATLAEAGLERYEVSNFARAGFGSQHNLSAWRGAPYLGVGPGAHSFWRRGWQEGRRWESLRSPSAYMRAASQLTSSTEPLTSETLGCEFVEHLDAKTLAIEQVMLGMRRLEGFAWPPLLEKLPQLEQQLRQLSERGLLTLSKQQAAPTAKGLLYADSLALEALR